MEQKFIIYLKYYMKHKTEDYKISAVKYYLKNNVSMDDVCEIFECSKT